MCLEPKGAWGEVLLVHLPASTPGGDVVGAYRGADGKTRGFLWSAGDFTTIDLPDSQFRRLTGINPQGDIVGYYRDLAGTDHGFLLHR